jgi:hypothetical protein
MKTVALLAALAAAGLPAAGVAQESPVSVTGTFSPVNDAGAGVTGRVTLAAADGTLTIALDADGVSPGAHLAHIHGYATVDPREAVCPDATADANGDGVIDLVETRRASGITMVPLTDAPASLQIRSDSSPVANDEGALSYQQQVPAAELEAAVQETFEGPLALPRRVVYLHGVPEGTDLPDSAASLEGVPAHVTLPIACAELEAVEE